MIKFGTDGIRGKYPDVVNENVLYRIGKILSLYNKKVTIGYDTRYSSYSLAKSIYCSLKEENIDVISVGLASTPKMMYISKLDHCFALMITASHNKYCDNGVKIFFDGEKITDDMKNEFENRYDINLLFSSKEERYVEEIDNRYEMFIKDFMRENKYKILIDTAFGAVSIAKNINLKNITFINTEYDGYNINDGVGALHPENILKKVQAGLFDYGFAFDGDGDRVIMCDKEKIYDGDDIIYFLSKLILKNDNSIVVTVMSNKGLIEALKRYNIKSLMCAVGDEVVYQTLKENNLVLGGEKAGHIIYTPYLSCGDGLFIALYIINMLNNIKKSFKEVVNDKQDYIQYNFNYPKEINESKMKQLKKLEMDCLEDERIYIRKSGTENLYRFLIESKQNENVSKYLSKINNILEGE